ncbi:hypothetical protein [Arthrobacter sp. efr-133-TYG-104]|uniref:hypothetical protein n=1 Tax=Arthrobacter sp. efr-133-TYG-104 TaxID=3040324 RepID=UPI00254CF66E|nr:hypothetical protein [Arthrobacter sp. efr-133-TYG-104]
MSASVPGFVPRMLVDPDIGLFRADERDFTAKIYGYKLEGGPSTIHSGISRDVPNSNGRKVSLCG